MLPSPAGLDGGADRGDGVVPRPGVAGQLGRRPGGATLEQRPGAGSVDAGPLTREQVVVDRLGEECVPERVVVAVDREHAEVDALARGRVELVVGAAVDLREHRVGHADAPGGDEAE